MRILTNNSVVELGRTKLRFNQPPPAPKVRWNDAIAADGSVSVPSFENLAPRASASAFEFGGRGVLSELMHRRTERTNC